MKKLLLVSLLTASLAACGSKAKKSTTPENKAGTTTEVKSSGSSTGGQSYGGAMTPASGAADPCAGAK